jgi:beta-lactamase regulating signal transducer with metallopeptidase domain
VAAEVPAVRALVAEPTKAKWGWTEWGLIVWVAGVGVLAGRLVLAMGVVYRMKKRARVCAAEGVAGMVEECRAEFGVRRRVTVLEAAEAGPMTVGIVVPRIVVPVESRGWTAERWRVVLRHEMAHIARGDVLTQALAQVMRAIYWCHPLAWYACARMASERERACDDRVLSAGLEPTAYAQELFAVARGRRREWMMRLAGSAALPMARLSSLEARLRAVLDATRCRRPLTGVIVLGTVLAGLGIVLPVAALRAAEEKKGVAESSVTTQNSRPATVPADVELKPGEKGEFSILGAVRGPGTYSMIKPKMTVMEAIALARGVETEDGESAIVTLMRRPADGSESRFTMDMKRVLEGMEADRYLQTRDTLIVYRPTKLEIAYLEGSKANIQKEIDDMIKGGADARGKEVAMRVEMRNAIEAKLEEAKMALENGYPTASWEAIYGGLRIRLVAEVGDTGPADEMADPNDPARKLRVKREVLLDTTGVAAAKLRTSPQGYQIIDLTFTEAGGKRMTEITRANRNKRMAVVIDGKLICAPTIMSEIGRSGQVSFGKRTTEEEARKVEEALEKAIKANKAGGGMRPAASVPATTGAASMPAGGGWRGAFEAAYGLKEGENLKFIGPGKVAERGRYFAEVEKTEHPMPYTQWRWKNGALERQWMRGGGPAGAQVVNVLHHCAGLDEYHTAVELGAVNCDGDWIVRDGATTEAILKDLQRILREDFKIEAKIEKVEQVREAYVVRGDYMFQRLAQSPEMAGDHIQLFTDVMDEIKLGEPSAGGGSNRPMGEFWTAVGRDIGMPMVDEAKGEPATVSFLFNYSLAGADKDAAKRARVLENIGKQTGLRFELEKRTFAVWRVTRAGN